MKIRNLEFGWEDFGGWIMMKKCPRLVKRIKMKISKRTKSRGERLGVTLYTDMKLDEIKEGQMFSQGAGFLKILSITNGVLRVLYWTANWKRNSDTRMCKTQDDYSKALLEEQFERNELTYDLQEFHHHRPWLTYLLENNPVQHGVEFNWEKGRFEGEVNEN